MEPFGRQPPRFVPTLTDVVPEGLPLQKSDQPQEPAWDSPRKDASVPFARPVPLKSPSATDAKDSPPSFPAGQRGALAAEDASEPVLDGFSPSAAPSDAQDAVVPEALRSEPVMDWADTPEDPSADEPLELDLPDPLEDTAPVWDAAALHETLVERILARVQPQLEAHLREVVADVVSQHAEAMARSLHAAVEDAVQHAVAGAITQEQIQVQLGVDALN